jgi:hypothetical protein
MVTMQQLCCHSDVTVVLKGTRAQQLRLKNVADVTSSKTSVHSTGLLKYVLCCCAAVLSLSLPQQFLTRALMPLHKPKCVAMYHQQLAYCVTQVGDTAYMR